MLSGNLSDEGSNMTEEVVKIIVMSLSHCDSKVFK
jgi:hypothetical protein